MSTKMMDAHPMFSDPKFLELFGNDEKFKAQYKRALERAEEKRTRNQHIKARIEHFVIFEKC